MEASSYPKEGLTPDPSPKGEGEEKNSLLSLKEPSLVSTKNASPGSTPHPRPLSEKGEGGRRKQPFVLEGALTHLNKKKVSPPTPLRKRERGEIVFKKNSSKK
jgi:hypothetical protein